ncbi:hypothetical protein [Chitinimonas sp.]|uniref:hypothetical protein n=1 Tax=Chitinimonas sp. TaxID=1934313 RepID=UPI0035B0F262
MARKRLALLIFAPAFLLLAAALATWTWRERLPFEAQMWIAENVLVPAYMAKPPVVEEVKISDWASFGRWVDKNVRCESDFMAQVQDKATLRKIRKFGIAANLEPEGTPDDHWAITRELKVFDSQVEEIRFEGDSGSHFLVKLAVAPETLVARGGATPPPPELYDQPAIVGMLFTRRPHLHDPGPDAIIVSDAGEGKSYIGCRTYDF